MNTYIYSLDDLKAFYKANQTAEIYLQGPHHSLVRISKVQMKGLVDIIMRAEKGIKLVGYEENWVIEEAEL